MINYMTEACNTFLKLLQILRTLTIALRQMQKIKYTFYNFIKAALTSSGCTLNKRINKTMMRNISGSKYTIYTVEKA